MLHTRSLFAFLKLSSGKEMYVMRCMGFTRVYRCSSKQTRPLSTSGGANVVSSMCMEQTFFLSLITNIKIPAICLKCFKKTNWRPKKVKNYPFLGS